MRRYKTFLVVVMVLVLSSCTNSGPTYNFNERKDSYLVSSDNTVMIYYKTDNDGKLVELNVDRLLTIEEMMILNPTIDVEYDLEGYTGEIFMEPDNICTDISNDVLIPINLEVGNTRYKFDNETCMYKTVDSHNEFKPGYSVEYLLTDTIPVAAHVTISIIVYNPTELINFVDIYELPNTYKKLGVHNILINRDKDGFDGDLVNYYKDISLFEQLYLKHQEKAGTVNEISGVATDINLMDLNSLTEITPLIDDFRDIYELELDAIEELQEEIGVAFEVESEELEGEQTEDPLE